MNQVKKFIKLLRILVFFFLNFCKINFSGTLYLISRYYITRQHKLYQYRSKTTKISCTF